LEDIEIENFSYLFDEDEEVDGYEEEEEFSPSGSPLYPRLFIGNSNSGQLTPTDGARYRDDNITNTWTGLLSFYG
jgi:hypothetical protein